MLKLLENIVENVPREKIHPNAKWFMQDVVTGVVKFSIFDEKPGFSDYSRQWFRGAVKTHEDNLGSLTLSEDAATTVITREELMRAYDLVEQGYTLWFGGDCPVEKRCKVDFVSDRGVVENSHPANCLCWDRIIAYKIVEPATSETPATGVKHDSGKPRFSLLPLKQVWQIVEVLEAGAKKYAEDNWKKVDNQRERYFNAAQRHLSAWWQGEKKDPETGLSHLAHVACCVLFLMWGDDNEK